MPCLCTQTVGSNFFCNYATGFCEYGIAVYGDPIMKCPVGSPADLRADLQTISENPFGQDTVYWNAMCNILPVYECKPPNGATLSASQLEACIQGLLNTNQIQGVYAMYDKLFALLLTFSSRSLPLPRLLFTKVRA